MEMTGSQLIPMPQEVVWAGLNDAEILKACLPGCESLQRVSDTEIVGEEHVRVTETAHGDVRRGPGPDTADRGQRRARRRSLRARIEDDVAIRKRGRHRPEYGTT